MSERLSLTSAEEGRCIEAGNPGGYYWLSIDVTCSCGDVGAGVLPLCRKNSHVFSHFVYRRSPTASLRIHRWLRANCLSYPPRLALHRTSQRCGQWLRRSVLHRVYVLMLRSTLTRQMDFSFSLWLNFLWKLANGYILSYHGGLSSTLTSKLHD